MKAIVWIIRKDWLRFIADRSGALSTLLLPVLLASLLSLIIAPQLEPQPSLRVLLVDLDGGPAAAEFAGRLGRAGLELVPTASKAQAQQQIMSGEGSIAIVLPRGIGSALTPKGLLSSTPSVIEVLFEPNPGPEPRIVEGYLMQVGMEHIFSSFEDDARRLEFIKELILPSGEEGVAGDATISDVFSGQLADGSVSSLKPRRPLEILKIPVTGPNAMVDFNIYAHSFAGMLCMFLLFMGMEQARQLLDERAQGALQRVQLSAASPRKILLGTALSTALLAVVISALVYLIAYALFDVRVLGSALGFILVLIAQAIFVGAFSLLLAGISRTRRQVVNIGTAMILLLSFVGGAWFPTILMPGWLQSVARWLPSYWSTQGLASMTWKGEPFSAALLPASILLGMAVVCAWIGARRFDWYETS